MNLYVRKNVEQLFNQWITLTGEPDKIPCPYCNRPLADEKQLESHVKRMHQEEKSHECPTCHKMFARETYLNQHLKLSLPCKPDEHHFALVETHPNQKTYSRVKNQAVKQETQAAVASIIQY